MREVENRFQRLNNIYIEADQKLSLYSANGVLVDSI
jgi:hypothetical protein